MKIILFYKILHMHSTCSAWFEENKNIVQNMRLIQKNHVYQCQLVPILLIKSFIP